MFSIGKLKKGLRRLINNTRRLMDASGNVNPITRWSEYMTGTIRIIPGIAHIETSTSSAGESKDLPVDANTKPRGRRPNNNGQAKR